MGFEQLSSITTGGDKLGQLLFTGTIDKNNKLEGSFEKVNNHKYIGSNSERLTVAQNKNTSKAVALILNDKYGQKEIKAERLRAITNYLEGMNASGKSLYREEVGTMIDMLNSDKDVSDEQVQNKLEAVRTEQEFNQLRKMTVESNYGLGNIVMTKSGGQFEKVNNHKFVGSNNIDIDHLGENQGKGKDWEANSVTCERIKDILVKKFHAPFLVDEAIGKFCKSPKDLTNRQNLSKIIQHLENVKFDFGENVSTLMAVKDQSDFNELCGILDKETLKKLDAQCAAKLAKGESANLVKTLFSPEGKYAVLRWSQKYDGVDKRSSRFLESDLENAISTLFDEVEKECVGDDFIETTTRRRISDMKDEDFVREIHNDKLTTSETSWMGKKDYLVREMIRGLLTAGTAASDYTQVANEMKNIKFHDSKLGDVSLDEFLNPKLSALFKQNTKTMAVELYKSAFENFMKRSREESSEVGRNIVQAYKNLRNSNLPSEVAVVKAEKKTNVCYNGFYTLRSMDEEAESLRAAIGSDLTFEKYAHERHPDYLKKREELLKILDPLQSVNDDIDAFVKQCTNGIKTCDVSMVTMRSTALTLIDRQDKLAKKFAKDDLVIQGRPLRPISAATLNANEELFKQEPEKVKWELGELLTGVQKRTNVASVLEAKKTEFTELEDAVRDAYALEIKAKEAEHQVQGLLMKKLGKGKDSSAVKNEQKSGGNHVELPDDVKSELRVRAKNNNASKCEGFLGFLADKDVQRIYNFHPDGNSNSDQLLYEAGKASDIIAPSI